LPPQARYVFKHALIQDAAYQSLLKSKRQQYHQQIARALEERLPETMDTQPELLAHHYTEAGLMEQALLYWQKAGERAVQRSANVEAISHFTKGLELLKTLPATAEHARQELTMQVGLGVPLRATKGFAAPDVGKAYARRSSCVNRWERRLSSSLSCVGSGSFMNCGRSTSLHIYGYDSGVACLGFGAWALWFLGYPDQALRRAEEALSVARQLAHPFSLAFALQFAAQLHHYRREYRLARELATEVITVSAEQGFPLWSGMGTIIRGWALAKEGKGIEGLAQIRQGIVEWQVTGFELEWPHFLALLAEAHETVDQPKEGLKLLAEARAAADKTGEGFWDAEMRRLHGELSLQVAAMETGNGEERRVVPEESFLKAIEIARRQQAKSLELRAVMSLSRLWQRQGKKDEARRMLTAIYGWFTEGRDTPDLREAKALREELS
jgi:tetratricopeptide (TPR) repeat protein